MIINSINPYNGKIVQAYKSHTSKQITEIVKKSNIAFQEWKYTRLVDRNTLLKKAAQILLNNKKKYAGLITQEMGKPISQSISEIEKCAWVCRYYAEHSMQFLKKKSITTEATKSYVTYQPLGVILAVMPWNFPFWQVFRFAAPTLMAGNTALLKHASNVSGCALAIQEVFEKAGFPKNIFNTVITPSKNVKSIIKNALVKGVSLTGSGPAGSAVASLAGKHLKKSLLELGGNDAYLVLEDADLKLAVRKSLASRMLNTGQSCIGAKRIIVIESVYKTFIKLVKAELKKYKLGDPTKIKTQIGPMAKIDLRDEVHMQVSHSIEAGATLVLGGKIPKRKGAFYPPTLLIDVKPGMPAFDDEIFGTVVSIILAKNEEDGITLANQSKFGLGGAVFSKNIKRAEDIALEIDAGAVAINDFVRSDPRLPFGGVKQSGFGRELARAGLMEFVNMKSVVVA